MTWYMVFRRDTGEAYSLGTQIADPMPPEFDSKVLTSAEAEALMNMEARWDAVRRKCVAI